MGIWRFAGVFTVALRQSECGAQHLLNARQPANVLRRVLPAGRLVVIQSSFITVVLIFCLSTQ